MKGETSWISNLLVKPVKDFREFNSFSDLKDEGARDFSVSLDLILPDDLLERILACLPTASILRATSVCKKWHEIISSTRFLRNLSQILSQKPWYFMFTYCDEPFGYAYDPLLRKWYNIKLPCISKSNCFIASSRGLVCFMDNDCGNEIYVCNPITKNTRVLEQPAGSKFSDYSALAVSASRISRGYTISLVKSKQTSDELIFWDISVHVYDSDSMLWVTSLTEQVSRWRGGGESVICDRILYILMYFVCTAPNDRHCLVAFNLSGNVSGSLMDCVIPVPCALTCGRLMNLKEKLVMVGGIGKKDRPDVLKGIGIWLLNGNEWQKITQMPHKFFQGFGEFDDVFASCGADDIIYIQSYGSPALLLFDMNLKQWKWSHRCPVVKKFPLQLFTGFCFEPRLEIVP